MSSASSASSWESGLARRCALDALGERTERGCLDRSRSAQDAELLLHARRHLARGASAPERKKSSLAPTRPTSSISAQIRATAPRRVRSDIRGESLRVLGQAAAIELPLTVSSVARGALSTRSQPCTRQHARRCALSAATGSRAASSSPPRVSLAKHDVAHEPLAARTGRAITTVAHERVGLQLGRDLAELDAEAADLDLMSERPRYSRDPSLRRSRDHRCDRGGPAHVGSARSAPRERGPAGYPRASPSPPTYSSPVGPAQGSSAPRRGVQRGSTIARRSAARTRSRSSAGAGDRSRAPSSP